MSASLSVVVLAAGKGTRMRTAHPKVLTEAAGRPLLAHVLEAAKALRPREVVVVVPPKIPSEFSALLARYGAKAAVQSKPLGTADAVKAGLGKLRSKGGITLILMGDTPLLDPVLLRRILDTHRARKARLTALSFFPDDPSGYGRILRDEGGAPRAVAEHKDLSAGERARLAECNAGMWAADPAWLSRNLSKVGRKNAAGELYFTDLLALAARGGGAAVTVAGDALACEGVNTQAQLAAAAALIYDRKCATLMDGGVTIIDPARTYVDIDARVGAGTILGPGVVIRGESRIGKNARIEAGAVIEDSQIGDGARILPYTVIEGSRVDALAQVGPLAHLRPGSRIGRGAKVGNFVELKKARLGPGAKANHLSYLGDADVGAEANISAGTITCNYDGEGKYESVIGPRAFIGSDSQLVAPVRVGAGAYVASGTTVTEDVPARALAIARTPQKNVSGWAGRKKKKRKTRGGKRAERK